MAPNTNTPAKRRRGEGVQRTYERIRGLILSLELPPGKKIDEAMLAELCKVSRTPVREALLRLAGDGLVVMLPNRVTQVAPLDVATIRDYLEGIDLCQRAVMRWACIRRQQHHVKVLHERREAFERAARTSDGDAMVLANRAFHAAIADAAGNELVADAYERFLDVGIRISRVTLNPSLYRSGANHKAFVSQVIDEHRRMVDCIIAQKPDEAEELARTHTEITRLRFLDFLGSSLSADVSIPDTLPMSSSADKRAATNDRAAAAARSSAARTHRKAPAR